MFRLMKVRPPNGWPAVWWELLIVTLGVLIALGAQQLVQDWQWRRDVHDVRGALNSELAQSLEAYRLRVAQGECARRRLVDLEDWLVEQEAFRPTKIISPIARPLGFSLSMTAWEQSGDAVARMPLSERIAYGDLYSSLRSYDQLRLHERDVWLAIRGYEGAGAISQEKQFELRSLVTQARDVDRSITRNWANFPKASAKLGIKRPADRPTSDVWRDLCQPLRTQEL